MRTGAGRRPKDETTTDRPEEHAMGAITVHEFTTVDGVVDTPRWTMDYGFPDDLAASIGALTGSASGILLGRSTFEMFAPAWSTRTVEDDPGAPFFNDTGKYVVSSTLADAEAVWRNSTVLGGYDADRIRALKHEVDGDLNVSGSATPDRAMLADGLVDELHLYVYPVAVGEGLRLFPEGTSQRLALLGAQPLSNGVVHLTYGPAPAAG
jgi:dihydrofolate reductase